MSLDSCYQNPLSVFFSTTVTGKGDPFHYIKKKTAFAITKCTYWSIVEKSHGLNLLLTLGNFHQVEQML